MAKTNEKPASIACIPYTQTAYGQLSRMLAKHIRSVAIPPKTCDRPALGVFALHSLFLYLDTSPLCHPSYWLAQAIFEPYLFLYKYPNQLIPVILPAYTAYEDGTEHSEMSAHKILTAENHPKERYNIQSTAKV
jgi:hypothetical protein